MQFSLFYPQNTPVGADNVHFDASIYIYTSMCIPEITASARLYSARRSKPTPEGAEICKQN